MEIASAASQNGLNYDLRPSALLPIAFGGVAFALWFWVENRRVQRECREQTSTFRASSG
jgi:hypothetical protein